jgi:hypothetical protein
MVVWTDNEEVSESKAGREATKVAKIVNKDDNDK